MCPERRFALRRSWISFSVQTTHRCRILPSTITTPTAALVPEVGLTTSRRWRSPPRTGAVPCPVSTALGQGPYPVQCPQPLDRGRTLSNVHSIELSDRGRTPSKVHGSRTGAVPCPMSTALQRPRAVAWLNAVIVDCIPTVPDVCRALRCVLAAVRWYPVLRRRHRQYLAASRSPVEVRTPPADCTRWGGVRLGRCPSTNALSRQFTGRCLDSAIQRPASNLEEPTSLRIIAWLPAKTTTSPPPEIAPRASDPRSTRCLSRTRVPT